MGNIIHTSKFQRGPSVKNQKTQIVTTQQRLIVMRTWERLCADMAQMGIAVLLRIFELKPAYKNSFSFCQKTGNDLLQDKFFRAHAFRFTQAANAVVENIDNLDEEVKGFLFELGRGHVGKPDFRVSYFAIISDAMAYVWEDQLKERFSVQTEQAWRSVFTFISGTMADGYIQEQMDREVLTTEEPGDQSLTSRNTRPPCELPPSMRVRTKSVNPSRSLQAALDMTLLDASSASYRLQSTVLTVETLKPIKAQSSPTSVKPIKAQSSPTSVELQATQEKHQSSDLPPCPPATPDVKTTSESTRDPKVMENKSKNDTVIGKANQKPAKPAAGGMGRGRSKTDENKSASTIGTYLNITSRPSGSSVVSKESDAAIYQMYGEKKTK